MWQSESFYTDLIWFYTDLIWCMTICNEQQQDVICKNENN